MDTFPPFFVHSVHMDDAYVGPNAVLGHQFVEVNEKGPGQPSGNLESRGMYECLVAAVTN